MPDLPKHQSHASKELRTQTNRNYFIVKGNPLVQDAHFTMSLADQKVLASLIRSIKPGQKTLKVHFSTNKFIRMLGLSKGGKTFNQVMNALYSIANDNFFIHLPDGHYHMWFWLKDVDVDPKHGGQFVVTFRPELKKYLFDKSIKYRTIYKFSDIMLMKSRYSIRLYEIFRSNQSRQKVQKRGLNYGVNELKYSLNLMQRQKANKGQIGRIRHDKHGNIRYKYPRFTDFKKRVLNPAVKEINKYTEYNIRIKVIRKGHTATKINVVMLKKNKKQLMKRDNRIFFITHHIPKSQWKTWREDTIRGNFRKVKPRDRKPKSIKAKVVHSSKTENPFKQHQQNMKRIEDVLNKHKIPFKEVNMGGNKLEYYNPWLDAYIWATKKEWKKQYTLYLKQQEIKKKQKSMVEHFRKYRQSKNK